MALYDAATRFGNALVRGVTAAAGIRRLPGSLDPRFGTDGIQVANFSNPNEPTWQQDGNEVLLFVGLSPSGRIYLVGHTAYAYHCRGELAVAAFTSEGRPDLAFVSAGPRSHLARFTKWAASPTEPEAGDTTTPWSVRPVAVALDGESTVAVVSVLLGWECLCGGPNFGYSQQIRHVSPVRLGCADDVVESTQLVRITPDGQVDPQLGWLPIDEVLQRYGGGSVMGVGVLGDGTIQVVGRVAGGEAGGSLVARFLRNGDYAPHFGEDGVMIREGLSLNAVAVQSNGKSIVAGSRVYRLLPDGSADQSFADQGMYCHPMGWWATHVVCQPPSKANADSAIFLSYPGEVVKLDATGNPDASFGSNGRVGLSSDARPLWSGGLTADEAGNCYLAGSDAGRRMFDQKTVVVALTSSGKLQRSFAPFTGRGYVIRPFSVGKFCFTPGNDEYWRGQWLTDAWQNHYYRTRWGQCIVLQQDRLILAGTTEADHPSHDFGLDFAMMGVRR